MTLTRGGERETDIDRNTGKNRDRNCNKKTPREAEIKMEVEAGRKQPERKEEG